MNPALYQLLEAHYRKQRLGLLIMAGICAVLMFLALGWGVAGWVDDPPRYCGSPRSRGYASCADRYYGQITARTAVLSGIPGVLLIIAGVVAFPLRNLSNAPLIRVFTSRKEEVAWLYPKRTSVRRYGIEVNQIHEVVVCLVDGKRLSATMTESDVQLALRMMAGEAPRAATGYSEENDIQYRRDPRSLMKSGPAAAAASARAAAPSARIAIAPDFPFARLDPAIRYLGFAAEPTASAPMPIPGEPAQAAWAGKGMRLAYTFDPMLYARVIEIFGGDPQQLAGELAGVVGVPVLGAQQVTGMLAAADPRMLLLGLRLAEATVAGEARRACQDIVGRLQHHPDPGVAQAAQRVARTWA
jgi:hypothetical protein